MDTQDPDLTRANREHDLRYGWSPSFPGIYFKTSFAGAVRACPGIDNRLPSGVLDPMVWDWHNGQQEATEALPPPQQSAPPLFATPARIAA